jgi:hypothetical protein
MVLIVRLCCDFFTDYIIPDIGNEQRESLKRSNHYFKLNVLKIIYAIRLKFSVDSSSLISCSIIPTSVNKTVTARFSAAAVLHAPALTSTVASVQQISATRNMHS